MGTEFWEGIYSPSITHSRWRPVSLSESSAPAERIRFGFSWPYHSLHRICPMSPPKSRSQIWNQQLNLSNSSQLFWRTRSVKESLNFQWICRSKCSQYSGDRYKFRGCLVFRDFLKSLKQFAIFRSIQAFANNQERQFEFAEELFPITRFWLGVLLTDFPRVWFLRWGLECSVLWMPDADWRGGVGGVRACHSGGMKVGQKY
jgi:hypothetical protein